MRVFDCFTFFNELDLLEIRLNTMDSKVDYFVIVESRKTFTLKDKPLYYRENKERFKAFAHKIISVVVDFEGQGSAWTYEFQQRNAIKKGLDAIKAELHDIVFVSDVDEIPNLIDWFPINTDGRVQSFQMQYYYYYLNVEMSVQQDIIKAFELKWLDNKTCQDMRAMREVEMVQNMGWHFSYLGGIEKIQEKIKAFSHQEMNVSKFMDTDAMKARVANGEDIFCRDYQFKTVSIDGFPQYIVNNQDKFKHLIK